MLKYASSNDTQNTNYRVYTTHTLYPFNPSFTEQKKNRYSVHAPQSQSNEFCHNVVWHVKKHLISINQRENKQTHN